MVKVLFVCLGNICRSPTAHGVFEHMLSREGLADRVSVESAGTGASHVGHSPDRRSQAAAKSRGFDLSHIRARKVDDSDFEEFDYILAMDKSNLTNLESRSPEAFLPKISLFLSFGRGQNVIEIPDPYYGGVRGFDTVLDLVESGCNSLIEYIKEKDL